MKPKSCCHIKYDVTTEYDDNGLDAAIKKYVRQYSCTELIRGKGLDLKLLVLTDDGYLHQFWEGSSTDEVIDWANETEDADGVEPIYIDEDILERIRNGEEATDLLTEEEIESIYTCIEVDLRYSYIFNDKEIVDPPHYEPKDVVDGDVLLFRIPNPDDYFDCWFEYASLERLSDKNQRQFEIKGFQEFKNLAEHARSAANLCARLKQSKIPSFIEICTKLGIAFEFVQGKDDLGTLLGWCPESDLAAVLSNASEQVDELSEKVASVWKQSHQRLNDFLDLTDEVPVLQKKLKEAQGEIDDLESELDETENEKRKALAERDAYRLFSKVVEANAIHDTTLQCQAGPLQYKDEQLKIIVSVNGVELPKDSLWRGLARKLLYLTPTKVQAVERIVRRTGRGELLSFEGTESDWANIEHRFDRARYKVIDDHDVEWDWQSELKRELEDPMAPAARLYERLGRDFCNRD